MAQYEAQDEKHEIANVRQGNYLLQRDKLVVVLLHPPPLGICTRYCTIFRIHSVQAA
jgi:hypothetical protein